MAEKNSKMLLDNQQVVNSFFSETRLIGIMAPIKNYRFCWQINNALGFDFRVNHDLEMVISKKERKYYFSVFEYKNPLERHTNYLYCNLNDGESLLPDYKHLDYLWLLKEETVADDEFTNLLSAIKNLEPVQLVIEIQVENARLRENLVF